MGINPHCHLIIPSFSIVLLGSSRKSYNGS